MLLSNVALYPRDVNRLERQRIEELERKLQSLSNRPCSAQCNAQLDELKSIHIKEKQEIDRCLKERVRALVENNIKAMRAMQRDFDDRETRLRKECNERVELERIEVAMMSFSEAEKEANVANMQENLRNEYNKTVSGFQEELKESHEKLRTREEQHLQEMCRAKTTNAALEVRVMDLTRCLEETSLKASQMEALLTKHQKQHEKTLNEQRKSHTSLLRTLKQACENRMRLRDAERRKKEAKRVAAVIKDRRTREKALTRRLEQEHAQALAAITDSLNERHRQERLQSQHKHQEEIAKCSRSRESLVDRMLQQRHQHQEELDERSTQLSDQHKTELDSEQRHHRQHLRMLHRSQYHKFCNLRGSFREKMADLKKDHNEKDLSQQRNETKLREQLRQQEEEIRGYEFVEED